MKSWPSSTPGGYGSGCCRRWWFNPGWLDGWTVQQKFGQTIAIEIKTKHHYQ
jgi:hypothetical protein